MNEPRLSPPVFSILSGLVSEKLGLEFDGDREIFEQKLLARASAAGFESALDYYYFLRYDDRDGRELAALADSMVVGETYFFRELDGLRAAVHHVVAPAVARNGRARIWSCACASGEEPLSMAMLLEGAGLADACSIVASDVSPAALERARSGIYRARSLRALEPDGGAAELRSLVSRWVQPVDQRFRVSPKLLARIDFRRVNLMDEAAIEAQGKFDLILCRNVLIYFSDATTRRVIDALARALGDEHARLVVGASESLLRFGTELVCEERSGAFLYGREE